MVVYHCNLLHTNYYVRSRVVLPFPGFPVDERLDSIDNLLPWAANNVQCSSSNMQASPLLSPWSPVSIRTPYSESTDNAKHGQGVKRVDFTFDFSTKAM